MKLNAVEESCATDEVSTTTTAAVADDTKQKNKSSFLSLSS